MVAERFQIHLSTALILLLEVGIMLWVMIPTRTYRMWSPAPRMANDTILRRECGWPVRFYVSDTPAGPPGLEEYIFGYAAPSYFSLLGGIHLDLSIAAIVFGISILIFESKCRRTTFLEKSSWFRRHFLTFIIFTAAAYLIWGPVRYILWEEIVALITVGAFFELSKIYKITGPTLFAF